ncbi:MAG TPA: lectin, partial [Lysobacter sp.]|nr:lectin [Lysobacter sp.]
VGEPHPSGDVAVAAGPARADGYGELRFGMTADEARKAWKGELKGDEVKPDNCAYLSPAGTARGPYLMFEQGRFVRYDVHGANTVAPGGGHVGQSADDIRRLYAGRVEEQPHQYVAGGKYLRVADAASKGRATLFEIDEHGRVTTWRVGQAPQVDYVEGCS